MLQIPCDQYRYVMVGVGNVRDTATPGQASCSLILGFSCARSHVADYGCRHLNILEVVIANLQGKMSNSRSLRSGFGYENQEGNW